MKVLVTGNDGYIGSALQEALIKNEIAVIGADKKSGFDINDTDRLICFCMAERPDVIIHLAGRGGVGDSCRIPFEFVQDNVRGTLSVLIAAKESGIKNVLFASSSSVYGEAKVFPTPETEPMNP